VTVLDSDGGADGRVARIRVDAARVARVRNLQVAALSPAGSPRVLHLEVTAAVTHGENSVIKVGAAAARQDAARVHLESHLVCLNCNRHGASLDCGLQSAGALANALVTGHPTTRDGGGERRLARSVAGRVRVRGLGGHVDSASVIEGKLHAAAVAAGILRGAVDKLLLGHGSQAAGRNLPSTLHAASGGESPAASALALILHWSHCTLGGPVNRGRQFLAVVLVHAEVGKLLQRRWLVAEAGCNLVLFLGEIGELVLAE